jgi:hypothetical protein
MIDPGGARSILDLVRHAAAEARLAADSMRRFGEDSPRVLAYADRGVPWSWAVAWFLAVSSGFGDQVSVVPAWRVDEGGDVSLAA